MSEFQAMNVVSFVADRGEFMNLEEVQYAGFCVCVFNIMPLNGLCSVCYHAIVLGY